MLSNFGCHAFQLCLESMKFIELRKDKIDQWLPELSKLMVKGRASLAVDVYLNQQKVRFGLFNV